MKVSIVVPVYKVEKYLTRCVESICNQSYADLEIILVDDGSPDRCPQMCDEFAEKDSRIKVIHKKNEGLGRARNTGIENATGEYICFFDSDDYIDSQTIELACKCLKETNADIVHFGMLDVNAEGNIVGTIVPKMSQSVYQGEQILDEVLLAFVGGKTFVDGELQQIIPSACSVMYNLKVIRKLNWHFVSEREILSEDIYSVMDLYSGIERAAILSEPLYYCQQNSASLSRTFRTDRFERSKAFYKSCLSLCEVKGYSEKIKKACTIPFLNSVLSDMKHIIQNRNGIKSTMNAFKHIIDDKDLQEVLSCMRDVKLGRKMEILCWAMRKRLYCFCYALIAAKTRVFK